MLTKREAFQIFDRKCKRPETAGERPNADAMLRFVFTSLYQKIAEIPECSELHMELTQERDTYANYYGEWFNQKQKPIAAKEAKAREAQKIRTCDHMRT